MENIQEQVVDQLRLNTEIIKNNKSLYLYNDNIDVTLADFNGELNKEDILANYYRNKFTLSDLFIVEAIATLTFADKGLIIKQLELMRKKEPDKLIYSIDSEYKKDGEIVSRLEVLCKNSLVRCFKFNVGPRSKVYKSYYCVTPHGYNYLKKIINRTEAYDDYIGVTPIDEVFKFLSAATVAVIGADSPYFKNMYTNNKFYIQETKKNTFTYAELLFEKDNKKRYMLIEPYFLNYHKGRLTEEAQLKHLEKRMETVTKYISARTLEIQPIIVFVCENMNGIRSLCNAIFKYFKYNYSNIYFTTEYLVFKRQDLKSSLFGIKSLEDGNPIVRDASKLDIL